jgi:hypothetical protein
MRKSKDRIGSGCDTNGVESTLYWNGGKSKLKIPLGENDNVSKFKMSPGYDKYEAFSFEIGPDIENCVNPITIDSTMVISDDEDDRCDEEEEWNPL